MPRTPFASAWGAVGGTENKAAVGNGRGRTHHRQYFAAHVTLRSIFTRRQMNEAAFVEEKHDSEGRVIAFCVDWRRSRISAEARNWAMRLIDFCRAVGLEVITYTGQPFMDVFPCPPDKGGALEKLKNIFQLPGGILYMGDSKADNPAFKAADISIGVVHNETPPNLECQYLLDFKDMAIFLNGLIDNKLISA